MPAGAGAGAREAACLTNCDAVEPGGAGRPGPPPALRLPARCKFDHKKPPTLADDQVEKSFGKGVGERGP